MFFGVGKCVTLAFFDFLLLPVCLSYVSANKDADTRMRLIPNVSPYCGAKPSVLGPGGLTTHRQVIPAGLQ